METACLVIPHFIACVERGRNPALRARPVVVVAPGPAGRAVSAASADATGVVPGLPLAQARARCPEAAVVPADPPRYREIWHRILDRLEGISPLVADGGFGCAYVDVGQLARLYRGEANLARALLAVAPPDWGQRLGLADAPFPAHLAATATAPGDWSRVPSDVAAYLAPFPVEALPLPPRLIAYLHSFGLRTLGQVAGLPLGAVQAQFGSLGRLAWELASGIDRRPLVPRRPQVVIREAFEFPTPATTIEALLATVENLLVRAFGRPELRGRCVRLALLEGEVTGTAPLVKRITFKEPVAGKDPAFAVLKRLLADLRLPGPIEALALTLSEVGGEFGRQAGFFDDIRRREGLREALRELRVRFAGRVPIYQIREVEPWSRIPERRRVLVPYDP